MPIPAAMKMARWASATSMTRAARTMSQPDTSNNDPISFNATPRVRWECVGAVQRTWKFQCIENLRDFEG